MNEHATFDGTPQAVRKDRVLALAKTLRKARTTNVPKEEVSTTIVEQAQAILDGQENADEFPVSIDTVPLGVSHSLWFRNALNFHHAAKTEERKQETAVFLITAAHDYCRNVLHDEYAMESPQSSKVVELDSAALETLKLAVVDYLSEKNQEEANRKFHNAARYLLRVESAGQGVSSRETLCTVDAGLFFAVTLELRSGSKVDRLEERTRKNLLNILLTIHDVEETVDYSIQNEDEEE